MTTIIFLDIDGVLNSEAFLQTLDKEHKAKGHHPQCECYRLEHQIDREAVARLNRLVDEIDAKIVISSSWRKLLDLPEITRILVEHGLTNKHKVIDQTPQGFALNNIDRRSGAPLDTGARIQRGHEIDAWLQMQLNVDRFVILDDSSDMAMHMDRLVQTSYSTGLLDADVERAIEMVEEQGRTYCLDCGADTTNGHYCPAAYQESS